MKRIIVSVATFVLFLFLGCKKDNVVLQLEVDSLNGRYIGLYDIAAESRSGPVEITVAPANLITDSTRKVVFFFVDTRNEFPHNCAIEISGESANFSAGSDTGVEYILTGSYLNDSLNFTFVSEDDTIEFRSSR